jgi:hypothetical protein
VVVVVAYIWQALPDDTLAKGGASLRRAGGVACPYQAVGIWAQVPGQASSFRPAGFILFRRQGRWGNWAAAGAAALATSCTSRRGRPQLSLNHSTSALADCGVGAALGG